MQLLMIDNYDSFTYNLVQGLRELGAQVGVVRNDAEPVEALLDRRPDGVVISPGPGGPVDAGVSIEASRRFSQAGVPVLGVCLGLQALAVAHGGRVVRAGKLMHGKTSEIRHDGRGVFAGLPSPFDATRYHSLVVERATVPASLEVTAVSEDGEIMGLRHRDLPLEGVQFHPESILTPAGSRLLRNFARRCAPGSA